MAKLVNEIYFSAPHRPGVLASVSEALGKNKVNILHLGACGSGKKGEVGLVTNKDAKAMAVLRKLGYKPKKDKVVLVSMGNKAGASARYFKKLAKAKVNVKSCMATTGGGSSRVSVILDTNNNRKAARVL